MFARGFFPKKLVLPGEGEYYELAGQPGAKVFDRMVFVVVDAMRSDFAFSEERSNMPFLHSLINDGEALPLTGHSTPPTVTLPRIKGLTTGSTPNFLDAILNIAEEDRSSTLAGQDSWLSQMRRINKRIHMLGDDTWQKLFPGMFEKTDGTQSFFVSDFTEVDNNVTRHIDSELASPTDWDVLILHYLGLDHIGHKGGPDSVFMPTKQKEMDDIVKKIYQQVNDDTLVVLLGDHGMNEAGNHGGSSHGETSAAMALLSRKFKTLGFKFKSPTPSPEDLTFYRRIQQADIVPTLAGLFGFPIPLNSLGVFLPELLNLWKSERDQRAILEQNAFQLANILSKTYSEEFSGPPSADSQMFCESQQDFTLDSDIELMKCLWWKICTEDAADVSTDLLYRFLYNAQDVLGKASSNYKESDMCKALMMLLVASVLSVLYFVVGLAGVSAPLKCVLIILSSVYCASMFGSSLVEEEHHFWYWGATGWVAWSYIIDSRKRFKNGTNWVICLILVRIIRSWNQTGQKYAGAPDIAKYLELEENSTILWSLIGIYYGSLLERVWKNSFSNVNRMAGFVFSFMTVVSSLAFKMNMAYHSGEAVPKIVEKFLIPMDQQHPEKLISLARMSFLSVGVSMLYQLLSLKRPLTSLSYLLEVFLVTQSRTRNIPIFILFNLMRTYVRRNVRDVTTTAIFILILQHVSFFALGNSNSMASIDLANAYNGVSSYNIAIVGILTFLSNWVGPIYWSFSGLAIIMESETLKNKMKDSNKELSDENLSRRNILTTKIIVTQLFFSVASAGIMGACLALKHHLFIWTVFSPKLLYAVSWVILQHGLIDTILSTVLSPL